MGFGSEGKVRFFVTLAPSPLWALFTEKVLFTNPSSECTDSCKGSQSLSTHQGPAEWGTKRRKLGLPVCSKRWRLAPVPGLFCPLSWISSPNPDAGSKREDSGLVSCFLDNFWWNIDHLQSLTTFFSQKSKSLVLPDGETDWRKPSNLEKQSTWKGRWPHEPVTAKHSRQRGALQTGQLSQGGGGCLVEDLVRKDDLH